MPNIKESQFFKSFCGTMTNLAQNGLESVLCAFSGGADSSAMIDLLAAYFLEKQDNGNSTGLNDNLENTYAPFNVCLPKSGTSEFGDNCDAKLFLWNNDNLNAKLFALHVNHMIRGEEADRDELFCINRCKELNIPLFVVCADIPTLAKELSLGVEETARNFRYDIFSRICKKYNISYVATAHNADDNLETIIFNLARGTGTKGLCGIEASRDNIIRPLLNLTKDEILSFCHEYNIEYVFDSTNKDTNYTRNFIRKEIVPNFKKLNPEATSAAARLSFLVKQDNFFIEGFLERLSHNLCVTELQKLPFSLLSRYLQREFLINSQIITGKTQNLSYVNIQDFIDFVNTGRNGSSLSLPNLVRVIIDDGRLVYVKDKETPDFDYCFPLMEGQNIFPTGEKIFVLFNEDGKNFLCKYINIYKLFIYAVLNFDKINDTVFVRNRRKGDKYRINNMTKSVKKLFSERKIPLPKRNSHPVICDSKGIIWIPDLPVRDGLSPDESENKLYLFYIKEN